MKQSLAEKYKTLSLAQLLEISNNPEQYTAEAFEAAKQELGSRQVTSESMAEATQLISIKEEIIRRNRSPIVKLLDWTNDRIILQIIPRALSSTEKLIRVLCIVLVVMVIPDFYHFIRGILFVIDAVMSGRGLYELEISLRIAVPVVIAFMLWQRKTAGWMLLCICLFAYVFRVLSGWLLYAGLGTKDLFGFTYLDSTAVISSTAIYLAVLYFMNRPHTRDLYHIGQAHQIIAAAIVVLLVLIKQAIEPS